MRRFGAALILGATVMSLGGCGKSDAKEGGGGRERQTPAVSIAAIEPFRFADRIEAVGTAYARESTVLTSTITERVVRLGFRDGERVRKGDMIAELNRAEESADLSSARAQLSEAQTRLNRLRALQRQGFATNAAVDTQVAAVAAARASAGVSSAQISDRIIRAPFAGVVGLRRLSEGATVSAGTEIATVSDISSIKVDFSLPEQALSAVRLGQPVELIAAAYPDEKFKGQIEGIDPAVDPVTRSTTVRAVLPNPDGRLRPGMLLTVQVIANPRQRLAVPETALVAERDKQYVFKVDGQMTALKTPVVIGTRQDGMVEVARGLEAGQRIVSEGTVKVRDGGKVSDADAPRPKGGGRGQGSAG